MDLNKFNTILGSNETQMIVLSASWCGPCKALKKTIDSILEKSPTLENRIHVCDIEDSEELVSKYHVSSVPTTFFIKDGNQELMKGAYPESKIFDFLGQ